MARYTINTVVEADSMSEAWDIASAIPKTFRPDEDWSKFEYFSIMETDNTGGSRVYLDRSERNTR
jgi:hypothetical protein